MKRVEIESLAKSFILFFVSQLLLVGALVFVNYKKEVQVLDESIFSKMRICSFDLVCKEFKIDFADAKEHELYRLYKDENSMSSYFSIPNSTENSLKIYLLRDAYEKQVQEIQNDSIVTFLLVLVIIVIFSFLFSLYTISPLRNALLLTEEFIKDILHDFNTPLSTLRLNAEMLKEEIGENSKITRMQNSVQNILSLQSNLRAYLNNHATQKERISLAEILQERIALIDKNYRDIEFMLDVPRMEIELNKEAFVRIIDNLLSNAAKYNKKDGSVRCILQGSLLEIQDSGKGIHKPKKVFDRFYKEQTRGMGIGLHIVKKLCEELGIAISLESKIGLGSSFYLELKSVQIH